MDQQEYIEKMVIPKKTTFKGEKYLPEKEMTFHRSEVGKLNWLSQQTSSLSQGRKGGTTEDMRRLISRERKTTKSSNWDGRIK